MKNEFESVANVIERNDRICSNILCSNDKGFIRACGESENHLFFRSLGKLYNAISREDAAYDETMAVIKELQLRISAAVKEYIKDTENIEVFSHPQ